MRIGIATSYFNSCNNYQETVFARALSRQGHEVIVFSTEEGYQENEIDFPYKIVRAKKTIKWKNTVVYCSRDIIDEAIECNLDCLFAITPDRGFSNRFIRELHVCTLVVSFFGDLWVNTKYPVLKKLAKFFLYQNAFQHSDLVVSVTKETKDILDNFWRMPVKTNSIVSGLPHDEMVFRYQNKLRCIESNDTVQIEKKLLITITRFQKNKPIKKLLNVINNFLENNNDWNYIIAGSLSDRFSRSVRRYCSKLSSSSRIQILPVLSEDEIVDLNNKANLSIWMQASIGVQQALACGLPAILPKEKYFEHIVNENKNALFYSSYKDLLLALNRASAMTWDHKAIASYSRQWSGEELTSYLIKKVESIETTLHESI